MQKEKPPREKAAKHQPRPRISLEAGLVEGVKSTVDTLRDLLSERKALSPKYSSDINKSGKDVFNRLKRHGYIDCSQKYEDYGATAALVDEIIMSVMENSCLTEPENVLRGVSLDAEVTEKIIQPAYAIVISDPDKALESDKRAAGFLRLAKEEFEKFRSESRLVEGEFGNFRFRDGRYLAHICLNKGLFAMRIDDGKHKGFIGAFFPEGNEGCFLYFNHYEHGTGPFPRNRIEYIRKALWPFRFSSEFRPGNRMDANRGNMRAYLYSTDPDENVDVRFAALVRMSKSVKNLDLGLSSWSRLESALEGFKKGVTNMATFLMVTGPRAEDLLDSTKHANLNEYEKELAGNALEARKWIKGAVEAISNNRVKCARAKELNFEILSDLVKMEKSIEEGKNGTRAIPKRELLSAAGPLSGKFIEMACLCDSVSFTCGRPCEDLAIDILDRFRTRISEFGPVLDPSDARSLMGFFCGRKGELKLEDVSSLEELVRFLHAKVVVQENVLSNSLFNENVDALRDSGYADTSIRNLICFNTDARSSLEDLQVYDTLKKALSEVPRTYMEMRDGRKAVAILGEGFAEISLPMGKHYCEINAEADDTNKCNIVAIRYIETDYQYAQNRKAYVMAILKGMGFIAKEDNGRYLKMELRTESKEDWARAFGETVRLAFSGKDLDLFYGNPDTYAALFKQGYTSLHSADMRLKGLLAAERGGKLGGEYRKNLWTEEEYSEKERRLITDFFLTHLSYRPSRILPLFEGYTPKELDKILEMVIDLELDAGKNGDKKKAGQLLRLGKKLEDLITTK